MPRTICTAKMCEFGPHFEILQAGGIEVSIVPNEVDLRKEPDRVIEQVQGFEAILAGAELYPRDVLEQLPDLRVISRYGVGYDAVDLEACDDLGIAVTITPGVNHHSVAEQAVCTVDGCCPFNAVARPCRPKRAMGAGFNAACLGEHHWHCGPGTNWPGRCHARHRDGNAGTGLRPFSQSSLC